MQDQRHTLTQAIYFLAAVITIIAGVLGIVAILAGWLRWPPTIALPLALLLIVGGAVYLVFIGPRLPFASSDRDTAQDDFSNFQITTSLRERIDSDA
jgi:CHASE2 domain-containing sensor protein